MPACLPEAFWGLMRGCGIISLGLDWLLSAFSHYCTGIRKVPFVHAFETPGYSLETVIELVVKGRVCFLDG